VEAIKYLMQDETAKKGELTKMRKGLLADGWMTDHKLPKVLGSPIFSLSRVWRNSVGFGEHSRVRRNS
jgi:hypothetical protein